MHGGGEGKASNSLGEAPTPACWFQALNIVDMLDAFEVSGIQHGRVCGGGGGRLQTPSGKCLHQPITLSIIDMLDAIEVSGIQHGRVCGGVGFKLLQGSAYTSPSLSVS